MATKAEQIRSRTERDQVKRRLTLDVKSLIRYGVDQAEMLAAVAAAIKAA
jgi:hypothetical protein